MVIEDLEQALLDQLVQTVELATEMPTRFRVCGLVCNAYYSNAYTDFLLSLVQGIEGTTLRDTKRLDATEEKRVIDVLQALAKFSCKQKYHQEDLATIVSLLIYSSEVCIIASSK